MQVYKKVTFFIQTLPPLKKQWEDDMNEKSQKTSIFVIVDVFFILSHSLHLFTEKVLKKWGSFPIVAH